MNKQISGGGGGGIRERAQVPIVINRFHAQIGTLKGSERLSATTCHIAIVKDIFFPQTQKWFVHVYEERIYCVSIAEAQSSCHVQQLLILCSKTAGSGGKGKVCER